MCIGRSVGGVIFKYKPIGRAAAGLSALLIAGVLPGCKPENQNGAQDKSSSVVVNRNNKTAKLSIFSVSQSKSDRKLGELSSTTLHQLKPSAILNNNKSGTGEFERAENSHINPNRAPVSKTTALAKFYTALQEIETGGRSRPVTILHLGSNQIAMDRFSGDLRKMFQERFGNAGRGMMTPGLSFPFHRADGVRISQFGDWKNLSSVNGDTGYFGLTGVLKQAVSNRATLTLNSIGSPFTWSEVSFVAGPDQGSVKVSISGEDEVFKTVKLNSAKPELKRIRLIAKGMQLQVQSLSHKPVTVSSWSIGEERVGIRYVNLGLPDATADHAHLWDASIIKNDLEKLNPELIILDYGVIESQNDDLDTSDYAKRFAKFYNVLSDFSPDSSFIVIGVRDLSRLPNVSGSDSPSVQDWACRDLSDEEHDNYSNLIKRRYARLNRWHPPPNLKLIRQVQSNVAFQRGGYFWDWSKLMGGVCGVHAWVHSTPPLANKNHVRLKDQGIRKSARSLFTDIVTGYSEYRQIAPR